MDVLLLDGVKSFVLLLVLLLNFYNALEQVLKLFLTCNFTHIKVGAIVPVFEELDLFK